MAARHRLIAGLLIAGLLAGCEGLAAQTSDATFSGERALAQVSMQMGYGARPTGSPQLKALGDAILVELGRNGWQTKTQTFTYKGAAVRNIIALKGGPGDLYLIGAHYDTRRRADRDPVQPGLPVPGANDGASGAAVLLELARTLDIPAGRRVMLAFFDAEDNGDLDGWEWIVGSRQLAAQLSTYAPVTPTAVVVVDMIGDAQQDIYYDGNSDPRVSASIWSVAGRLGYADAFRPAVRYSMLDDHTPFAERGIPSVDIIDFDYPHWHRTTDTLDKLSAASLERVGRTLEVWLEGR